MMGWITKTALEKNVPDFCLWEQKCAGLRADLDLQLQLIMMTVTASCEADAAAVLEFPANISSVAKRSTRIELHRILEFDLRSIRLIFECSRKIKNTERMCHELRSCTCCTIVQPASRSLSYGFKDHWEAKCVQFSR